MTLRRQRRIQSRFVTQLLIDSLLRGDEGWVVRTSAESTQTKVEYSPVADLREIYFTLTIKPGRGSCWLRFGCFETVELRTWTSNAANSGAVTWLHPCDRCRLKKAVELLTVRWAHEIANRHLKKPGK